MAKMIFSLEEMIEILLSNDLVPSHISDLEANREKVSFMLEIGKPISKSIPTSVKVHQCKNSIVTLEISVKYLTGKLLETVVNWLIHIFSEKIPDYAKLEYPKIYIDINRLLVNKNIKKIQVDEIFFDNGEFTVMTRNI